MPSWLILFAFVAACLLLTAVQAGAVMGSWRTCWEVLRGAVLFALAIAAACAVVAGATWAVYQWTHPGRLEQPAPSAGVAHRQR